MEVEFGKANYFKFQRKKLIPNKEKNSIQFMNQFKNISKLFSFMHDGFKFKSSLILNQIF